MCHVYIYKGDEMWVGLINKNAYSISGEIEKEYGSLLYYGGRERSIMNKLSYSKWDNGNGAIHGFGGVYQQCDYYQTGDWITFEIDQSIKYKPNCKIYKNGKLIADINALPLRSIERKQSMKRNKNLSILSSFFGQEYMDKSKDTLQLNEMNRNKNQDKEEIYFCVVVDDSMDGFIVEEILYNPSP